MAGLVEKFKEMWSPSDEYEDYDEQENFEQEEDSAREYKSKRDSRVISIHDSHKLKVILVKPERFCEDVKNIADELLKKNTIVLNLEKVIKSESRRMIDFLSGVAYANGGQIKNVSADTFVITPCNVDLQGDDFVGELGGEGIYF